MLTVQRRVSILGTAVALAAAVYLSIGTGARPSAVQDAGTPDAAALVAMGDQIYNSVCVTCHQPGGVGVVQPGAAGVDVYYPPLAGNPFVTLADPEPPIRTLLQGRGGMPQFRTIFSDEEIAGVLTYARQSWGNNALTVSPEQVAAVRAAVVATPVPAAGTPDPAAAATPVPAEDPTPAAQGTPTDPSG